MPIAAKHLGRKKEQQGGESLLLLGLRSIDKLTPVEERNRKVCDDLYNLQGWGSAMAYLLSLARNICLYFIGVDTQHQDEILVHLLGLGKRETKV